MKKYTSIKDILNLQETIKEALLLKAKPFEFSGLGKHKTLVMLFFNSSLRTRLSTEKAAKNLGMNVMILNVNNAWNIEFEDGTIMSNFVKHATVPIINMESSTAHPLQALTDAVTIIELNQKLKPKVVLSWACRFCVCKKLE